MAKPLNYSIRPTESSYRQRSYRRGLLLGTVLVGTAVAGLMAPAFAQQAGPQPKADAAPPSGSQSAPSASQSAPAASHSAPSDSQPATTETVPIPKTPIGFSNLIVRLQGQNEIGMMPEGDYKVQLLEHMRRRHYAAVGAENLVFGKDESRRAAFLLGGTVREIKCHHESTGVNCELGVEWQVLNVARDAVVYTAFTRGAVYNTSQDQIPTLPVKLLTASLDSLLRRDRFREALTAPAAPASQPTFAPATFAPCAALSKRMPEVSPSVLQATVVVRTPNGHGSGFFLTPDGLILTAAHVVDGSSSLTLKMRDGTEVPATAIRINRQADVALLRTSQPVQNHACLTPAAETTPTVGSELYAAGAPASLELAFSLTRGIVSGVRLIEGREVLQTDAPISPGNSGGPLLNSQGAVMGITSFKVAAHTVEGIAFGIPITSALASLSLRSGTGTDPTLLNAPAADTSDPTESKAVKDSPDPMPVLHRHEDTPSAAEALEQADTAMANAREFEKDLKQHQRDLDDAASAPTEVRALRWGGVALGVSGLSLLLLDSASQGQNGSDHGLQVMGWGFIGLGACTFIGSFVLDADKPEPVRQPPPDDAFRSQVRIGLGSVQWAGTF